MSQVMDSVANVIRFLIVYIWYWPLLIIFILFYLLLQWVWMSFVKWI